MRQGSRLGFGVLLASLLLAAPAAGQERGLEQRLRELERRVEVLRSQLASRDSADIALLRLQIEAITRELEELRLGRDVVVEADSGAFGLGPAAAKVYRVRQGVSIGGYGEALYENFSSEREDGTSSGKQDQIDALRAIVYVGYKFSDQFLFNSEVEFEHASTSQSGSVSLEFAYLDYVISDGVGVRGGLLLIPMGFVNELHEPPTFLGSRRPETETAIVPSTWRENGVGLFGELGSLAWRAYLINGFDAVGGSGSRPSGFSAAGLRGGRQKGSKAIAEDFAGVLRLDYVGPPGLLVGASAYLGGSGQAEMSPLDGETIGASTFIWEGHAEYRAHGVNLRGLVAVANVSDVEALNAAKGLTGDSSIGERLLGWYVQGGYDVLHRSRSTHQLVPFLRYERLDTQNRVPAGFSADPANDRDILTLGLAWLPIGNVVVKADYQIVGNRAETGVNQLNLLLGYLF